MSLIGAQLANRYEIVREIGRGGMGVVYLARDPYLERDVAIKVLTATATDDRAQTRFRREALVVAKMDHPGIVSVYDVGSHDGELFFVMPYVEGVQLRSLMRERSLSLGDVVNIGIQVAEALEYSHQRAVVHRDIKPENLIVHREEDGWLRVRITDFGLARAPRSDGLTLSGALIGTVAYLSPEQVACRDVSHRADLYALGVMLYECLSGRTPFSGEVPSILYRIAHEPPPAFSELGVEVSTELEALVFECLAKDPANRPVRAADVAQRLEGVLRSLGPDGQDRPMYLEHQTLAYEHVLTVSDFVGREVEMVEIVRRLESGRAGTAQLVLILGEAGIGKSRLLLEVESVARSRGFHVCRGGGGPEETDAPFTVFADIVHDHLHQDARLTGERSRQLTDLSGEISALWPALTAHEELSPPPDHRASGSHREPTDLVAELIERIGDGRPLAVLLDDLHCSSDSVELLGGVLERVAATPTVLVATHQWPVPESSSGVNELLCALRGQPQFVSIVLGPFDRTEHRRFVTNLAGTAALSDSMIERVFVATDGSPSLAFELVQSLLEHGSGGNGQDPSPAAPRSPRPGQPDSIERTLEELDEELDAVLAAASVIGHAFDFRDLEELCGASESLDDAVDRLVRAGLLREDRDSRSDRLRFVGQSLRDAVYDRLARRRRKQLHRRFAETLEARSNVHRSPRLLALMEHYLSGGAPEKAVDFAILLARRRISAGELDQAESTLATVIALFEDAATTSPPAQEAEARALRAEVRAAAGAIDAALKDLEKAYTLLEASGIAERRLEVCCRAADTAWQRRRVEETRMWIERGLACGVTGGEPYEKLVALAGSLASLQGDGGTAAQLLAHARSSNAEVPTRQAVQGRAHWITVGLGTSLGGLDPMGPLDARGEVVPAVFETLTRHSGTGSAVPWLASSIEVEQSGRRLQIRLREGVQFHDGRPLTTRDVRASFERLLRRPGSRQRGLLKSIVGAEEILDGSHDRLAGVHLVSDRDMIVELEHGLVMFPAILSAVPIVAEISDPQAASWQDGCVGTGPFRVQHLVAGSTAELERNPYYWREGYPHSDGLLVETGLAGPEIAARLREERLQLGWGLSAGELESLFYDPSLPVSWCEVPTLSTYLAVCNCSSGPLADQRARQRLASALSTSGVVDRVGRFGVHASSLIPPGLAGSHPPGPWVIPQLRPLTERVPLNVMILSTFEDAWSAFTDAVFAVLDAAGFDINLVEETHDEPGALSRWPVDLLLNRWLADYPDADSFVHGLLHSTEGDVGQLCGSGELDDLIDLGRETSEPLRRQELYRQIDRKLAEDVRVIPLFHEHTYRMARSTVADPDKALGQPSVAFEKLAVVT